MPKIASHFIVLANIFPQFDQLRDGYGKEGGVQSLDSRHTAGDWESERCVKIAIVPVKVELREGLNSLKEPLTRRASLTASSVRDH